MSYKSQIPPSFGIKNSYADQVYSTGETIYSDKITGDSDITVVRKVNGESPEPPTPPVTVEFTRYKLSELGVALGWSLYIPTASEVAEYFADVDNSEVVDPQPNTFGYAQSISIDSSKGVVYQGIALNENNYIVKNNNIVMVFSKSSYSYPAMEFTYNDTLFVSNDDPPTSVSNIGIVGFGDSGWTCDVDSIIIGDNGQIFIGNNVGKVVEFDRYSISILSISHGWSFFIPDSSIVSYFDDISNSEAVDPQPDSFGYLDSVTIDTSLGTVYQCAELDANNYIVKNNNIVMVYTKSNRYYPPISFYHSGVHFVSKDGATSSIATLGIVGASGASWACAANSIIIGGTNEGQMFIGTDVSTPIV